MAWPCPLHGRSKVNVAGEIISNRKPEREDFSLDSAVDIAANWRSSHGYPLHVTWLRLTERARRIDSRALVAKRIKRMPSIIGKLKNEPTMQLTTMHDLGGCRAVMTTVPQVHELVTMYEKLPPDSLEFYRPYDYIANPKPDGYRSIHRVYKYKGESQKGAFKGLRIEIQFRSRMQHAWATALEIIDTFTGQGLKAHRGEEPWKRFFLLVSAAMAMEENCPPVPGAPENHFDLILELGKLCESLNIPDIFTGIATGIHNAQRKKTSFKPEAYILVLDSQERATETIRFASNKAAAEKLLEIEKENIDKPYIQAVMASANSLQALPKAYPNYFLDTATFTRFVRKLISPEELPAVAASESAIQSENYDKNGSAKAKDKSSEGN